MLLWHARYILRRLSSEYVLSQRCTRSSAKMADVTASGDNVSGFWLEICSEFLCSCHCSVAIGPTQAIWRMYQVTTLNKVGKNKGMQEKRACFEPLWRQKRTFLSSCHTQDCSSTGILPITECDLILTDGADELRCAAGFFFIFYSSSAEILKTFSWAFFAIVIWAFSRTAAHGPSCPGSIGPPWPQSARPEALTLAHLFLWKTLP